MATRFVIVCDYCGRLIATSPLSASAARRIVRERGGFTRVPRRGIGRGKDACSKCAMERRLW